MKHILNLFISLFSVIGIFGWAKWSSTGANVDICIVFIFSLVTVLWLEFLYYFRDTIINLQRKKYFE
jgi:hypothetical protein